jgi:hypothetical protein
VAGGAVGVGVTVTVGDGDGAGVVAATVGVGAIVGSGVGDGRTTAYWLPRMKPPAKTATRTAVAARPIATRERISLA